MRRTKVDRLGCRLGPDSFKTNRRFLVSLSFLLVDIIFILYASCLPFTVGYSSLFYLFCCVCVCVCGTWIVRRTK